MALQVSLREQDISLLQMFMQMHFTLRMLQRSNRTWRRTNSLMPPSKVRPTSLIKRVNIETTSEAPHIVSADKAIALSDETTSDARAPHKYVIEHAKNDMTSSVQTTFEEIQAPQMSCIESNNKDITSDIQTTEKTEGSYASCVELTKPDVMRERFAMPSYRTRHPMLIRVKSEPSRYGCISAEEDGGEETPDFSLDAEGEGMDRDANIASGSTGNRI